MNKKRCHALVSSSKTDPESESELISTAECIIRFQLSVNLNFRFIPENFKLGDCICFFTKKNLGSGSWLLSLHFYVHSLVPWTFLIKEPHTVVHLLSGFNQESFMSIQVLKVLQQLSTNIFLAERDSRINFLTSQLHVRNQSHMHNGLSPAYLS